jgi:hypothetical protein
VTLNGKASTWKNVISGVPQGSVLGPVLFAILIDTLKPLHSNTLFVKYADDVTVIHNVRSCDDDKLKEEWAAICEWSEVNMLPINFNKTNTLDIITKKNLNLQPLVRQNKTIDSIESAKLLGVIITSNMKWDLHIESSIQKASKSIFILTTLKSLRMPQDTLWCVYYALTRSILTYALPSMCNMPARLFSCLERVEARSSRIIGSDPPVPLHKFCNELCVRLARYIQNHSTHPLHSMFQVRHGRCRANKSSAFMPPYAKTSRYKDSFIKFA